jgi:hypothetical protein
LASSLLVSRVAATQTRLAVSMSPVASREAGPKVYRGTGPAQGYVLVQWMGNTFHFVGMRPAAGTSGVGNGRPSRQTWIAHSEISVVPVPPAGSGDHRSRLGDERIAGRVEQSLQCFAKFWRSRILKRAKLWARVADDIRPLKEPATIGRALNRGRQAATSRSGCNASRGGKQRTLPRSSA